MIAWMAYALVAVVVVLKWSQPFWYSRGGHDGFGGRSIVVVVVMMVYSGVMVCGGWETDRSWSSQWSWSVLL